MGLRSLRRVWLGVALGSLLALGRAPAQDLLAGMTPVFAWQEKEPATFDGSAAAKLADAHKKYDPAKGFTVSLWARPKSFSRMAGLVSQYAGSRDGAWYLALSAEPPHRGLMMVFIDQAPYPAGYRLAKTDPLMSPGEWSHILLSFDGRQAVLFFNGKRAASLELNAPLAAPSKETPLLAGGRGKDMFDGQIRDLRLYDQPLKALPEETGTNFLRNSSFEWGASPAEALAWHRMAGSDYMAPAAWEVVREGAKHGAQCLKGTGPLVLQAEVWDQLPDAKGWTFSAWLRADRDGVPCELRVGSYLTLDQEIQTKKVALTKEWRRHEMTAVSLHASRRRSGGRTQGPMNFWIVPEDKATVWVDAAQWEPGSKALAYAPSPRDAAPPAGEFQLLRVPESPPPRPVRPGPGQTPGEAPILVHHAGSEPALRAPVTLGVPFPAGAWNGQGGLSLVSGADATPVQAEILAQRQADGSVQSLGLSFEADLRPGRNEFSLRYDPSAPGAVGQPGPSLLSKAGPTDWRVDLDEVRVEMDPGSGRLWERIADRATGQTLFGPATVHAAGLDGTAFSSLHAKEIAVEVEKEGPVLVSIARRGMLTSEQGQPLLMFTARLHLWRSLAGARLELTVANARAEDSVVTREVWWRTQAAGAGRVALPWASAGAGSRTLLQYAAPDPFQFVRASVEDGRLAEVRPGEREETWLSWESAGFACHLQALNGWRQHPTMLSAGDSGELRGYVWPAAPVKAVEWTGGLSITRDFVLARTAPRLDAAGRAALAETLGQPPEAMTSPAWFARTDLLLPVRPSEPGRFPFIEGRLTSPDMLGGLAPARIEDRHMHGLFDFGDSHGDGGWSNLESYADFSVLLLGLRNGDPAFLRQGMAGARHYRDVDINQVTGGCITHSPNHVMGGSSFSHAWPQGVYAHYLLTGSRRSREVALRNGDHMLRSADIESGNRTLARYLTNLTDMYQITGDKRYFDRFMAQLDHAEKLLKEHPEARYASMFGRQEGEGLVPFHGWYGCTALIKMRRESGDQALLPHIRREVETVMDMNLYRLDLEQLWPGLPPETAWPIACADFARHRGAMFYPVMTGYTQISGDPKWADLALRSLYAGALEGRAIRTQQAVLASAGLSAAPAGAGEEQLLAQARDLLWGAAAPGLLNGDFSMSKDYWDHWRPCSGKSLAHHESWQRERRLQASLDAERFKGGAPSLRIALTSKRAYGRSLSMDSARFQMEPGAWRFSGWVCSEPQISPLRVGLWLRPLNGECEALRFALPPKAGAVECSGADKMVEVSACRVSDADAQGWRQWVLELRAPARLVAHLAFNAALTKGTEGSLWLDGIEAARVEAGAR